MFYLDDWQSLSKYSLYISMALDDSMSLYKTLKSAISESMVHAFI